MRTFRWFESLAHSIDFRTRRTRGTMRRRLCRPRPLAASLHGPELLEDRRLLATMVTVDTFMDVVSSSDGVTSLREAIMQANADSDDFVIQLQAGTYWLTRTGAHEDFAATGDLDVANAGRVLTIAGAGAGQTIIHAGGNGTDIPALGDRVFHVLRDFGGDLTLDGVTITGGNSPGFDNRFDVGGGILNDGTTLTVTGSTISGNSAAGTSGGGIANFGRLIVTGSTLSGNSARTDGGGIFNRNEAVPPRTSGSGIVTVTGSTISGNSAEFGGGGINNGIGGTLTVTGSTLSGNSAGGQGGGINNNSGTLTVTNSTLSGNTSAGTLGGGGISNGSTLTVTNSTLSGNSANAAGGGIFNFGGQVTVTNSTLVGNRADANDQVDGVLNNTGGGIHNLEFAGLGDTTLFNTLVAGNLVGTAMGTADDLAGKDVTGDSAFNLIGDAVSAGGLTDGEDGNIVGVDVTTVLDTTLADNGGPMLTHALVAGGPAINMGDPNFNPNVFTPPLTTDQRGPGFDRVVGGPIDIGAFEFVPLRGTTVGLDGSGDLVIEDTSSGGKNDTLSISLNGANVRIHDPNNPLGAGNGTTQIDANTIQVPLSSITGQIVVNTLGGDDTLTVDFSGGNPIPSGGLTFNGGGGNDGLVVTGGSFGTVDYDATGATNGTLRFDGSTVQFTGLEPVDLTGSTIGDLEINVDPASAVGGTLTTTVSATGGTDTVVSFTGGLESTTFRTITGTLTINGDDGDGDGDIINVSEVGSSFAAALTIDGKAGADTVNLDGDVTFAAGKSLTVAAEGVTTAAAADVVTSGAGVVSITADDVALDATSTLVSAATVTLTPQTVSRPIDLGTETAGSLSLTDAELDRITAGTLVIGDANTGTITVSGGITRTAGTDVELHSGGPILLDPGSLDTGGGELLLDSGAGGVRPVTSGVDAIADTVAFGSDLAIAIDGPLVDSQFNQLNVSGTVNLAGVNLVLGGTHVPAQGDVFTIVSATSVMHEFNGLADGELVTFNGRPLRINYTPTAVTLSEAIPPNANPEINALSSSSPAANRASENETVSVFGSFADPDALDTHTVMIDWGDGTPPQPATVNEQNGAGTFHGDHEYAQGGIYTVAVTLTDGDGATDTASTTSVIIGAGVNDGTLYVIGTEGSVQVVVYNRGPNQLRVSTSFLPDRGRFRDFAPADVQRIIVALYGGHDHAAVAVNLPVPALVDGGDGIDLLWASGPAVLLGGDGDDYLIAGRGRSVLIGGAGADRLVGGREQDILITGWTTFDTDYQALEAILGEWSSGRDRDSRINNLQGIDTGTAFEQRNNQSFFLLADGPNRTVFDDGQRDYLIGVSEQDWLFANLDGGLERDLFYPPFGPVR